MIKLIIFDLDGVLIDTKKFHYEALNKALGKKYEISLEDHYNRYDGLKTTQKLKILSKEKGLPTNKYEEIWKKKQEHTIEYIKNTPYSEKLASLFSLLEKDGYLIACCSNSIRKTVTTALSKLGIIEYFDLILSNEDVNNAKPYPEIYNKCMHKLSVLPEETLIVEDSPYGLLAAHRSFAKILRVNSTKDVNYVNISDRVKGLNFEYNSSPKWVDKKMNIVVPMAGEGSRFKVAGFSTPKPLIDVEGKPMIQLVVDNINIEANYIFIVQKDHKEKYNLDCVLNMIAPNCSIICVDSVTEGAACTTLLSKNYIDNDYPLLISNSDQFIVWDSNQFMYNMNENNCDASVVTFNSKDPKWSYVKINEYGYVTEVAEKEVISETATVGIYYWKKGRDYVKYAEQMINKGIRVKGEFYVCPVFNEAILDGKKIKNYGISKMYGLGTPEDLQDYLNAVNKNNN